MTEEFFVKLAGIRKVRTPGGSAYFDLPIGAPITADAILKAKKKHAAAKEGSASSSGGSGGSSYSSASGSLGKSAAIKSKQTPAGPVADKSAEKGIAKAPAANVAANKKLMQANGAAVVQPKPQASVENSSLSGPKKFKIGEKEFDVPEGSKLFRSKSKDDRAFVIDPEGRGHVFMSKGEVKFPDVYMEALVEKLNGDLTDTDYVPAVFESDGTTDAPEVSSSLADMPEGQVLRDAELTPQFVKQADGTWKHTDLDIDITSDKLQPLVDSGELQPTTPEQDDELQDVNVPKEIDFGKFETTQEFYAEIDQYEAGDQLVLDKGEEQDPDILTKDENGKWNSSASGTAINPNVMYALKDKLSGISPEGQKGDQEKITPDSVEADDVPDFIPDPEDTKPLNAKSKPAEAPVGAEKADTSTTTPKKASKSPEAPSKAAEAPFVDPYPFVDLDGQRWKSEKSFTDEGGNASELENAPRTKEEYVASKPTSFSDEEWMSQAVQPGAKATTTKPKPEVTKIKIGDLKPGDEVGGGTILQVGPDPKNKKKIAVKYKSKYNGTIKTGSWWKSNDIQVYPADAPNPEDTEFKGIPNAKKFDGDVASLKKGEFLFFKSGDELRSLEKVNGAWFRRDGDPWSPDNALPLNLDDEDVAIIVDKKGFVTDALGNSAIQAKNMETKKKKFEKLKVEGLSDAELDELEAGSVIAVEHDPNKSPKNFVATNNGQWMDGTGAFFNTSGLPKGKKESVEGEDSDNFKSLLSDTIGKDSWLNSEPLSSEEIIDNSIQQSIAETEDLAPAEPKGIKTFYTTGENTPSLIPEGWKEFHSKDIVDVPIGDKIIVKEFESNQSLKFERVKGGWKEESTETLWSTGEILYNSPAGHFEFWTNDGLPDDDVNEDGFASSKAIHEGTELDVESVEDVASLPSNFSIQVGNKKFAHSDNGLVNTASGAPITEEDLKGKKVIVDSIIPEGDEPVPFYSTATGEYVQPGQPLTSEAEFTALPKGAQVHMGSDDVTGVVFTKTSTFNYSAPGFDVLIPQDDLISNFNDGIPATYIGMTKVVDEGLADWEKELLGTPFGPLGKFNKSEIVDAVNALEAHSGFQISYGLKAVPDNKITKNQAVIKEQAQKEFPELKPKPAFVAFLKKYGSIEDSTAAPKKEVSGTKVYKIGADSPKKTGVQGWDGGEFTAEDIQDAINILEGFQGKNFKSELNKKGNALGKLDPNPIVGFNKDKTVTKQKLIDHLKGVLGNDDPVADIEDTADQPVVDNLASIADGLDAPTSEASEQALSKMKISTEKPTVDTTVPTDKNLLGKAMYKHLADSKEPLYAGSPFIDYYPHNTVISNDKKQTFKKLTGNKWVSNSGKYYEKEKIAQLVDEEDDWVVSSIPDLWGMDEGTFAELESSKSNNSDVPDVDAGNPADDKIEDLGFDDSSFKVGDKITPAILIASPAGTKIANYSIPEEKKQKYFFTKQEDGTWLANASNTSWDEEDLYTEFGKMMEVYEVVDQKPDTLYSTGDIVAQLATPYDIETAVTGKELYQANGTTYYKGDLDQWSSEGYTFKTTDLVSSGVPLYHERPEKVYPNQLEGLPAGTALKNLSKKTNTHLVKHPDSWYVHNDSGEKMYPIDTPSVMNLADEGLYMYKSGTDELSAPSATPEETNKVSAGKYTTTGKVFMYVNADGSGVYVDKAGKPKKLTPNAVQKNYDAGMNKFLGNTEPVPSLDESVLTKPAPKKAKTAEGIPDGVYYIGLPSSGKATKIVVKDGEYTQFKPATGTGGKVGAYAEYSWLNSVGDGAEYRYNRYDYSLSKTVTKFFVKKDGKWLDKETGAEAKEEEKSWSYTSIVHTGYQPGTKPAKKTLETKFAQGALLDEYATSVVPEGYSGSLLFLGGTTTGQQLADLIKETDDPIKDWKANVLQVKGLIIKNETAVRFLKDQGVDLSDYESKSQMGKYFFKYAQDVVDGLDVEEHESNAAELFTFNAQGQAEYPLYLAANPISDLSSAPDITNWVNTASGYFGDGKIIGQHLSSKASKIQWANYLSQGNFESMYILEVAAAAEKGLPHVAGYLHPGYPGNKDTNKVTWASAVKGEIPAGEDVDGDWTTLNTVKWSIPEIDNFLIKAQMQNPQYLTTSEKRNWVQWHRSGKKSSVDKLSAKAAWRAKSGETEYTGPLTWTEGIVPAKSYDYLFDNGVKYPSSSTWSSAGYQIAHDWMKDHQKDEDFLNYWKTSGAVLTGYSGYENQNPMDVIGPYDKVNLVGGYFDEKEAEYQAELLKPVYTMVKKLAGGQNTTWLLRDQFERKAVFKPIAHNKGTEAMYRVEVENASNNIGVAAGFHLPESSIGQVGEDVGQIQKFIENQGDFEGIDLTKLTDAQLAQVAGHQVLDHFLQNDDTHHRNLMIDNDGNVVGIDKGRSFLAYGTYDGLAHDPNNSHMSYNMLSQDNLVYAVMINRMRNGDFTPEQAREAYLGAMKAARRINRMSNEQLTQMIREGVKNRPDNKWGYKDYHYFADKKTLARVPKNADELVERVLESKANILDEVQAMYDAVFEAAGWDKPEMPKEAIPGHTSGWQEESAVAKAVEAKVFGNSALHASGSIVGGSSVVWTETDKDDKEVVKGSFKVGKFLGKKVDQALKSSTTGGVTPAPSDSAVADFPNTSTVKSSISAAGKNLTKNLNLSPDNKKLDPMVWSTFEGVAKSIDADLEFYTPELLDSTEPVTFPSGVSVPANYVSQYHMALMHYKGQVEKINKAKETDTPTNKADFTPFEVTALSGNFVTYQNSQTGEKYKKLNNDKYLYTSTEDGIKTSIVDALPSDVSSQKNGWTATGLDETPTSVDVKLVQSHVAAGKLTQDGVFKQDGTKAKAAQTGKQFEVTLPTGEVIAFRSDYTGAYKSQANKFFFQTAGEDYQASLDRIEAYLASIGVDMRGAEDPELLYWRSMFHKVVASGGGNSKIVNARSVLQEKAQQAAGKAGVSKYDIGMHDITEVIAMGFPEEELSFYRNLADETWGKDVVAKFLAEERHLPKYQHMNLNDGSVNTGHAYWERIDVDVDQLKKKGTMLAVAAKGKDNAILKYITSGGLLSTEQRARMAPHTGASQSEDQSRGGADYVYSRVAKGSNALKSMGNLNKGNHTVFLSPEVLASNDTYGYESDNFGDTDMMTSSPYDVSKMLDWTYGNNEVMIKDSLSILDFIELMVFTKFEKRNEAIQRLKALGWDQIRGLPVEDRLVMRENLEEAIQKVKASWK